MQEHLTADVKHTGNTLHDKKGSVSLGMANIAPEFTKMLQYSHNEHSE